MDVTTNCDWGSDLDSVGLILQYFLGGLAEFLNGNFLNLLFPLDLLHDFLNSFARCHLSKLSNNIKSIISIRISQLL